MTFSILGADESGAVGIAVASSSPAVGARCVHLTPGIGGASSQNITDPRLGVALVQSLADGATPDEAIHQVAGQEYIDYRQLTVINTAGDAAAFSGARSLGTHTHRIGHRAVAAGNMLSSPAVIDAMIETFEAARGELEDRLLASLEAGHRAGGEAGPVHSACLAVVRQASWRDTDLRVDWSDTPVQELRSLVQLWLPQRDDYITRGLNPTLAPSYGVPGDE